MRVKMVASGNYFDLEQEINKNIEEIEKDRLYKVIDIKLFGDKARALIIYNKISELEVK